MRKQEANLKFFQLTVPNTPRENLTYEAENIRTFE